MQLSVVRVMSTTLDKRSRPFLKRGTRIGFAGKMLFLKMLCKILLTLFSQNYR